MKDLTINQIILLLDIYRGTDTQLQIGTRMKDIEKLFKLGLINKEIEITEQGNELSENMRQNALYYLNVIKKP